MGKDGVEIEEDAVIKVHSLRTVSDAALIDYGFSFLMEHDDGELEKLLSRVRKAREQKAKKSDQTPKKGNEKSRRQLHDA